MYTYSKRYNALFLGPPNSRPSKLVEKIIDRIRVQERMRRQATGLSLTGAKAVRVKAPGFVNVVNQAMARKAGALKGASAFRAAVHSVLSPANREYMDQQARRADRSRIKKKLVLGNKTFSIDEDDLSVVDESQEKRETLPDLPDLRDIRKLSKRDSAMSMVSSCSVESDWSDEELEELEKMFGSIQHKSSMAENTAENTFDTESISKWRQLKKSRRMAMAKLQQKNHRLSSSSLTNSSGKMAVLETSEMVKNIFIIYHYRNK